MKKTLYPDDETFKIETEEIIKVISTIILNLVQGKEPIDKVDIITNAKGDATDFTLYISQNSISPIELTMNFHIDDYLNN